MIHHITADRFGRIRTPSRHGRNCSTTSTIHSAPLCDEDDDRKTVFRTLRYARIRLHVFMQLYLEKMNRRRVIPQIRFLHIVIGYIDTEFRDFESSYGDILPHRNLMSVNDVDGNVVELVELIYALHEMKRIDNGEIAMNELAGFFGELFGIRLDARSLYDAYTDIKRRKGESRTYFLDKLRERLNLRMQATMKKSGSGDAD